MAEWIIEMPEGITTEMCLKCRNQKCLCDCVSCHLINALANAKEAVEIGSNSYIHRAHKQNPTSKEWEVQAEVDGQPVVLYAVKAEGEE